MLIFAQRYLSMKRFLPIVILCLASFSTPSRAQETEEDQGKLRDFGKAVEQGNSGSETGRVHHDEKTEEEREREAKQEQENVELAVDILHALVKAFISAPRDTSTGPEEYHTFAQYPYFEQDQGLYKIGGAKDFSMQLKANFYREGPALMGGGARLRVSPLRYFSGEAYVNLLSEQLENRTDRMMLSSFFINYHLVRQNTWALWLGIGDKLVRGAGANEDGIAGNMTLEVYPINPVSLHANISWGPYSELFTTMNFHANRYSFFVGYQAFFAGPADLRGIVAGSSFYF